MKRIEWLKPARKAIQATNPPKRLVPLKETGQKWQAAPAKVPTDRYADGAKGLAQIKARIKTLL